MWVRLKRGWTQDIEDSLGIRMHAARELATSRESFEQAVKRPTFCDDLLHEDIVLAAGDTMFF